ncbi:MAG: acyltransferase [Oscillospiraceae bacterium]|nr:acyltransferase [Oscillospiraceae bacterium]
MKNNVSVVVAEREETRSGVVVVDCETIRPIVDFLRAFSISTIVLMHLIQLFLADIPPVIVKLSSLGGTGAHVFFFCSGFGLCFSQLRRPLTARAFWARRFGKVYLPYLAAVLLSAAVPMTYAGGDRILALLSHVFLYKMFIPAYIESFGVQFWFVSALLGLYLLFLPLCAFLKRYGRKWLLTLGFLISILWWIFVAVSGLSGERVWNSFCLQFVWEFALGMVLADYLYRGGQIKLTLTRLLPVALIGLSLQAAAALSGSDLLRVFNDLPALFGYGSLILLCYLLTHRWLEDLFGKLARISYGWYLLHMLIFTLV